MRQTSLNCYYEIIADGTLGVRQKEVLQAFRQFGAHTNLEISQLTGLPINSVTPRTLELRKAGILEEAETKKCEISGRKAIVWRLR